MTFGDRATIAAADDETLQGRFLFRRATQGSSVLAILGCGKPLKTVCVESGQATTGLKPTVLMRPDLRAYPSFLFRQREGDIRIAIFTLLPELVASGGDDYKLPAIDGIGRWRSAANPGQIAGP